MDWSKLPYNHAGRWESKYDSVMNPGAKCSWPNLIVQWVVETRSKYMKSFPKIQKGKGWSVPIAGQIRGLCQQASVICNYFPHPSDDPLVEAAFRNYFKHNRVFSIGAFRKTRKSITQNEKDIVKALEYEYKLLKDKEARIIKIQPVEAVPVEKPQPKVYKQTEKQQGRFGKLMDIEKSLTENNCG